MRIAYLVNQYPKVSHVFIRRETLALERRGVEVVRIALRGWDGELVDGEDLLERERTRYVLRDGAAALLLASTRMLLTRPLRLLRALALAWRIRRAERPRLVHLAYLAEACRIEPWLHTAGIQHLHTFRHQSAEVAMLVHALGGRGELPGARAEELTKRHRLGGEDPALCVRGSHRRTAQPAYRLVERDWHGGAHCGLSPRAAHAIPRDRRRVGRLCEQRQLLLVGRCTALQRRGRIELVLVGRERRNIEALIRRYNLQAWLHITGWISGEQVRDETWLRGRCAAKLCRGLPVVMEAMALRRPSSARSWPAFQNWCTRASTACQCRPGT
jgi:hypothetical protein